MITIQEAQAKALAYGRGEIPLHSLPPVTVRKSEAGICDYCNQHRPIVMKTSDSQFLVCWKDINYLKGIYGEEWETKAQTTLFNNRQSRLQVAAQNANKKKGVTHVGF